jgi:hypothetical protein
MSTDLKQEPTFARRISTAIMCLLAVSLLAIAVSMDDDGVLVQAAAAAETNGAGYFPAQFPTVDAPVEPHIEAF